MNCRRTADGGVISFHNQVRDYARKYELSGLNNHPVAMIGENVSIALIGMESNEGYHGTSEFCREKRMANHAVSLRVTPFLRIECKFWLTDDGWKGSCEQLSLDVQAGTFEFAKSEMEIALGKHLEALLHESRPSAGQAA